MTNDFFGDTLANRLHSSHQLINYTSVDGSTTATFDDFDYYLHVQINNSIILGVRIGTAGLAMLALLIVSRNRKTPVFFLNQICLLLMVIHSALYISYLLGDFATFAYQFTGFQDVITQSSVNISIATNFFQVILVTFVEASLVFQVRTMFQGPGSRKYAFLLTTISLAAALSCVGLYLYNFIQSASLALSSPVSLYSSKALLTQTILFSSSINLMTALLIGKLVVAIRSRRYLGLKQFDGFHILLIMSTQSLIIPSVLLVLTYAVDGLERVSLPLVAQLLVVLSLPLSSMWAASANDSTAPTSSSYYSYSPTSFKSPIGTGSSLYTQTLRSTDDEGTSKNQFNYEAKAPTEALVTPSTAIDEEARKYWLANSDNNFDDEDEGVIVHKTIHKISS